MFIETFEMFYVFQDNIKHYCALAMSFSKNFQKILSKTYGEVAGICL